MRQVITIVLGALLVASSPPHYDIVTGGASSPFAGNDDVSQCGEGHYDGDVSSCADPSFDLTPAGPSTGGYDYLSPSIKINGQTVAASIRCIGEDADADSWNCTGTEAEDLPEDVAPGAIDVEVATPDTNDRGVTFNDAGHFASAGVVNGQIETEDFVIEGVFTVDSGTSDYFGTRDGNNEGWTIRQDAVGIILQQFEVTAGTQIQITIGSTVAGDTIHILTCADRDEASVNGVVGYLNSVAGTGVDGSAGAATILADKPFTIGANGSSGLTLDDSTVSYVAMWKRADWFAGGAANVTECTALARQRFARLIGLYPQIARGTATPTAMTRATSAKFLKGNAYHNVGDHWLRIESDGYLAEPVRTNKIVSSDQLGSTWTATRCTVGNDGDDGPVGDNTMDSINGTAVDDTHSLVQVITTTAATWAMSAWATADNLDFVRLENDTVSASADFQISTCTVGTTVDAIDTFAEIIGGECRIGFSHTATAAANAYYIYACEADNDCVYTGDTTADIFLGAVQVEEGGYPSSPITTTAASGTVTRNADVLTYKTDDGSLGGVGSNKAGTLEIVMTLPAHNSNASDCIAGTLSDGGSANDRIVLFSSGSEFARYSGTAATVGVWDEIDNADVFDAVGRTYRITWGTDANGAELFIDGTQELQDTTVADVPDDLDTYHVGMFQNSSTGQAGGHISRVTLWPERRAP